MLMSLDGFGRSLRLIIMLQFKTQDQAPMSHVSIRLGKHILKISDVESESDILAGVGVLFLRANSDSFNFDLTQIEFLIKVVIFFKHQ